MSEVKFTQGPWKAISNGSYYDVGPKNDSSVISIFPSVCIGVQHEREFDAFLIATAPEMYSLLNDAMIHLRLGDYEGKLISADIDALLAKARGENA